MENLLKKMESYMLLKNYSSATIRSYLYSVKRYYLWCEKEQRTRSGDKAFYARDYLIFRREQGVAWQSVNGEYSAIKLLYEGVLYRDWSLTQVPRPKNKKYLPFVISQLQVKQLIDHARNFKHQFYILLLYGTGLRLSESLDLRLSDLNIDRLQLFVRKGKGGKSRYIHFPKCISKVVLSYLDYYHPVDYLFNGQQRGSRWSNRSGQESIYTARVRAGLPKGISAHTLRHCYATHHLEKGTDLFTLQKQMGHKYLKTTARYVHLCTNHYQQIKHPVTDLCLNLKHTDSETCLGNMEKPS